MKSPILFQLWKSLTKTERSLCRKWLQSPFHNQRSELLPLFEWLDSVPDSLLDKASKENIYALLFPGKTYDNDALNYVFSFLVKQIEAFLAWEEMTKNETGWHDLFLVRALRKRGVNDAFERKINLLEKTHTEKPQRNADWHLLRYQIQHEKLAQLSSKAGMQAPI